MRYEWEHYQFKKHAHIAVGTEPFELKAFLHGKVFQWTCEFGGRVFSRFSTTFDGAKQDAEKFMTEAIAAVATLPEGAIEALEIVARNGGIDRHEQDHIGRSFFEPPPKPTYVVLDANRKPVEGLTSDDAAAAYETCEKYKIDPRAKGKLLQLLDLARDAKPDPVPPTSP